MLKPVASDEELVALLRQFRSPSKQVADDARRRFYESTVKAFDRHALYNTGYNEELAKQAMQEAWIKIMTKSEKFDPREGKVIAWANGIIRHCALDELRKHYKHSKRFVPNQAEADSDDNVIAEYDDGPACPALPADEGLYQHQVARATALCIEALPRDRGPNYRLAMELALDPDLSYAEMTGMIQGQMPGQAINAEQVRGWVRYAVKRMRACVDAKLGWNKERK